MSSSATKARKVAGFPPVSAAQWKKSVRKSLKNDSDYEKKLVWKPAGGGIEMEPFYGPEHMRNLTLFPAPAPGNFPFTRESSAWTVCEDIPPVSASAAARMAGEGEKGGAESVVFRRARAATPAEISKLVSNLNLAKTGVCFDPGGAGLEQAGALADFIKKSKVKNPKGFVLCDPIGEGGGGSEIRRLAALVGKLRNSAKGFGCVGVRASRFHAEGAEPVEEAAFGLALGAEYLAALAGAGVPPRAAADAMVFHFDIGSTFFLEIAKLRAARAVWAHIVEKFDRSANGRMRIHASASMVNKPVCDPEVNILRATCEAMAAIAGGSGSISISAFDVRYAAGEARSQTVARNIQLILRDECGLGLVADPCAGSYYADTLTDKFARAALDLFLEVEKRGGFMKCRDGFIAERLKESKKRRGDRVAAGSEPLIGVNRYPLEGERIAGRLKRRGHQGAAKEFERLRADTEKGGKPPLVFLVKTGDPAMRSARAVFSANFFATAGFEIKDGGVFGSARSAAAAAAKSGAKVFAVCSEDGAYGGFAPQFAALVKKRKKKAVIAVAGNAPAEERNRCEEAGCVFINVRSNLLKTLREIQKSAGVRP